MFQASSAKPQTTSVIGYSTRIERRQSRHWDTGQWDEQIVDT